MNRVRGQYNIIRRCNVQEQNDYHKYRDDLREDFYHICGYCGKHEKITKHGFEIDHFVPIKIDNSKKTKYDNLVYSCFTCNRKKSSDWPTKDTNVSNNGVVGYVDPATPEFDNHLERNEEGKIIAKTPVGAYMVKKLKFDMRPIEVIHKLNMLIHKKNQLSEMIKTKANGREDILKYIEIQEEIDSLMDIIFLNKE